MTYLGKKAAYFGIIILVLFTGCDAAAKDYIVIPKTYNITNNITNNVTGGPYHPHDQSLNTTDNVLVNRLSTGLGYYELYAMNQNVRASDTVTFDKVRTNAIIMNGINEEVYWSTPGLGFLLDEAKLNYLGSATLELYGDYHDFVDNSFTITATNDPVNNRFRVYGGGFNALESDLCTGNTCATVSEMLDDDPEQTEVHWSDLTDQGTHNDGEYCAYDSGSGYINCNETITQTPEFDGNISEMNISGLEIYPDGQDYIIQNHHEDDYTRFVAQGSSGPIDFMQIGGTNDGIKFAIEPNETVSTDVGGTFRMAGDYTFTTIGIAMSFTGSVTGQNWFFVNAQPTANVTGQVGIFRFNPNYVAGVEHKAKLIEFIPDTHDVGVNDEYRIVQSVSNENVYAFADDNSTTEMLYFEVGGKKNFGDFGSKNRNYTEVGYHAIGGLNRQFGTEGILNQTGFECSGFGDITNPTNKDNIYCMQTDGGELLYDNSVMNQTNGGYSLWNLPHAEVWNVTENGYTITISALNTWYNFTGILAGETDEFTLDNGIIPTHDGRYKVDWSVSFSGSGGSTHAISLLINGTEHEPCRSYRKLGTAGDVGSISGNCILTAWANANITGAVMDINAPAQNIDVWSMNADVIRVGEI